MEKIGIITMTGGENYGNKLQNYSVQEVFRKLNYQPITIINSTKIGFKGREPYFKKIKKFTPKHVLKVIEARTKNKFMIKNDCDGLIKSMFWIKKNQEIIQDIKEKRKRTFEDFFNEYIISSDFTISINNTNEIDINSFKFFICGSDQIWNPYYPQNSMIDFLVFAPESKRIAYAPSFGVDHIPKEKKEIYKKWIKGFSSLSVREEQGAKIIKELTGRDAVILVDPSFMLTDDEWMKISKKPEIDLSKKYILTYFLGNQTRRYQKLISTISQKYDCKIINLGNLRDLDFYFYGPREFLYLIKNAFLMCTDSFHGVVFSIIMKTNFIVFNRIEEGHSMNSRINTILKKFDLQNRNFSEIQNLKNDIKTDFSNSDKIIKIEQKKTFKYLEKAINKSIKT